MSDFNIIEHFLIFGEKGFCDLDPISSYEGTYEVNSLVRGKEVTGIASFKTPLANKQLIAKFTRNKPSFHLRLYQSLGIFKCLEALLRNMASLVYQFLGMFLKWISLQW